MVRHVRLIYCRPFPPGLTPVEIAFDFSTPILLPALAKFYGATFLSITSGPYQNRAHSVSHGIRSKMFSGGQCQLWRRNARRLERYAG
jgi:hypothetical protein